MASENSASVFWELFGNSPLLSKWPDFRDEVLDHLELVHYRSGQAIYGPGVAPVYLYLVGKGLVEEHVVHPDPNRPDRQTPWLRIQHPVKSYFGQHALFEEVYRSSTVALEDTTLYRMTAADLRRAMEHNPELYEELLREKRAGRLRRIPLLRSLADDEVRWLAQITEEIVLNKGATAPQHKRPSVWIIDWGQIMVTGAANPLPRDYPAYGLTSGNFFAGRSGPQTQVHRTEAAYTGLGCLADTAVASLKTKLFRLPADHADLLLAQFPDFRRMAEQPLIIWGRLKDLAETERARFELAKERGDEARQAAALHLLFNEPPGIDGNWTFSDVQATEKRLERLAQFWGWEFVPAGQNITTQGSIGHSFVLIKEGKAVVTALDEKGRPRPRNVLNSGEFYGETSLLKGKMRDATVRAVKAPLVENSVDLLGAEVLVLDRRDAQYAFSLAREPWMRHAELWRRMVKTKMEKKAFDWMQEGEVLQWRGRPHFFWLLAPELPAVLMLALWLLLYRVTSADLHNVLAVAVGLTVAIIAWIASNYSNDYYAITNLRIVRRDHILMLYESFVQAPVDMIQDVVVETHFWARLFDYGNVLIRTAGQVGPIKFEHTSNPYGVRDHLQARKAEVQAEARGLEQEDLRRSLIGKLGLALPIPQRVRPLGEEAPSGERLTGLDRLRKWWKHTFRPPPKLPPAKRPKPKWLQNLVKNWPERWRRVVLGPPPPTTPPAPTNEITWRKHWLNLVERAGPPFAVLLLVIAAGIGVDVARPDLFGLNPAALLLPWLFVIIVVSGWLWWNYTDYRNDLYTVTDEKLIDVEMKPLGLSAERRETGLDKVLNVDLKQRGVMAQVFDYGDVVVKTAALDMGFTFLMVPHPKQVQATVWQKLDAYKKKQRQKEKQDRQQDIISGIEVYHQLQKDRLEPFAKE